jgi:acetate---CoA ligase (ADP-forming)
VTRDLRSLFDPTSVAIVGASDDRAKWGYSVAFQALRAGDRRPVHLVNRRGGTILGRIAATSLTDIGQPLDLVVISVPATSFEATVDEALALGARSIIGITAGFAELGAEGAARQAAIVSRVRAAGAVLVGPNCLGLVDNTTQVYLSSDRFTDGSVALLSQSGNLALELELRFAEHGLGFSRFVSFGNQADVSLVDLIADCASHAGTAAIAVYAEDFADGRGFAVAAASALAQHGKPVVLLTAGAGEASARSAKSHTGALTSSSDVVAAACRDAGIHLTRTPRELTALLAALTSSRRATGRRTAILTDGGGHGSIAADVAERAGLVVPPLSPDLQDSLAAVLWAQSAVGNPVDLAGMGEQDPMSYANALGTLLSAAEIDGVLMTGFFGGYAAVDEGMGGGALGAAEEKAGHEIARLAAAYGKPLAVQSMYPQSPSCRPIASSGTPVFGAIEDAAAALAAVVGSAPPNGFAPLPPVAPPIADFGYYGSRRLLAAAGVTFPTAIECGSAAEIRAAAAAVGSGPYVLKAMNLLHKSDAGGVAIGLASVDDLLDAYATMHARLGAATYSVEAMADLSEGLELIVGVNADARFGPVAMVGLGGLYTEVLNDVTFALAPLTPERAEDLLLSLRTAALLTGARGRRAVDVKGAAAAIAHITEVAAGHPEIAELEVNPLFVSPSGAIALDARCVPFDSDVEH